MGDSRTVEQFAADVRSLAGDRLFKVLKPALTRSALQAEAAAKDYIQDRLKRRTGNLYNSVSGSVRRKGDTVQIVLGAGGRTGGKSLVYAATQERGNDNIRPTRGQWLAIPSPFEPSVRTAAGVSRYASARDYPEPLRFVLSKQAGRATLRTRDGRIVYLLRKRVSVRGKHFLRDGIRDAAKDVPTLVRSAIAKAVADG